MHKITLTKFFLLLLMITFIVSIHTDLDWGIKEVEKNEQRYVNFYEMNGSSSWFPEEELKENLSINGTPPIIEVSRYHNVSPTKGQINSAWKLYKSSFKSAKRNDWFNITQAKKDGFKEFDSLHYINEEFRFKNKTLNPNKPESLIFDSQQNSNEKQLVGFMYLTKDSKTEGKQVGGHITTWHYHPLIRKDCAKGILGSKENFRETNCKDSKLGYRTSEMLHVWFVENPDGIFSPHMNIDGKYISEPKLMDKNEFKQNIELVK